MPVSNRIFRESDLQFKFNKNWIIIAFDKTDFYKQLSGQGVKGVDFILLHKTQSIVYFIEIKNYDQHGEFKTESPKSIDLAKTLCKKWTDTLNAIHQINTFYSKWIPTKISLFTYKLIYRFFHIHLNKEPYNYYRIGDISKLHFASFIKFESDNKKLNKENYLQKISEEIQLQLRKCTFRHTVLLDIFDQKHTEEYNHLFTINSIKNAHK